MMFHQIAVLTVLTVASWSAFAGDVATVLEKKKEGLTVQVNIPSCPEEFKGLSGRGACVAKAKSLASKKAGELVYSVSSLQKGDVKEMVVSTSVISLIDTLDTKFSIQAGHDSLSAKFYIANPNSGLDEDFYKGLVKDNLNRGVVTYDDLDQTVKFLLNSQNSRNRELGGLIEKALRYRLSSNETGLTKQGFELSLSGDLKYLFEQVHGTLSERQLKSKRHVIEEVLRKSLISAIESSVQMKRNGTTLDAFVSLKINPKNIKSFYMELYHQFNTHYVYDKEGMFGKLTYSKSSYDRNLAYAACYPKGTFGDEMGFLSVHKQRRKSSQLMPIDHCSELNSLIWGVFTGRSLNLVVKYRDKEVRIPLRNQLFKLRRVDKNVRVKLLGAIDFNVKTDLTSYEPTNIKVTVTDSI